MWRVLEASVGWVAKCTPVVLVGLGGRVVGAESIGPVLEEGLLGGELAGLVRVVGEGADASIRTLAAEEVENSCLRMSACQTGAFCSMARVRWRLGKFWCES